MQKSSEEIANLVYLVNVKYTNKQNKTKEIFFKYLEEKKSKEEFEKEISKIWDNVNHSFMDQQIKKLQKAVNKENVTQAVNIGRLSKVPSYKATDEWVIDNEYFKLTPESYFIEFEQKFKKNVVRNYEQYQIGYEKNPYGNYLNAKIDDYNKNVNQVVTYFTQKQDTLPNGMKVLKNVPYRKVQLSTYLSMLHNTDLTRGAWNQTISDAKRLNANRFLIPYHPFCCIECYANMNRPLSLLEVENIVLDTAVIEDVISSGSVTGNILHPNCKCTLSIYWSDSQLESITMTDTEVDAIYKIRQKVNGLTLEKSNLRTDIRIAKELEDYAKVDKYKARISAINRNIRNLRDELPTSSLKKQVTAIKR